MTLGVTLLLGPDNPQDRLGAGPVDRLVVAVLRQPHRPVEVLQDRLGVPGLVALGDRTSRAGHEVVLVAVDARFRDALGGQEAGRGRVGDPGPLALMGELVAAATRRLDDQLTVRGHHQKLVPGDRHRGVGLLGRRSVGANTLAEDVPGVQEVHPGSPGGIPVGVLVPTVQALLGVEVIAAHQIVQHRGVGLGQRLVVAGHPDDVLQQPVQVVGGPDLAVPEGLGGQGLAGAGLVAVDGVVGGSEQPVSTPLQGLEDFPAVRHDLHPVGIDVAGLGVRPGPQRLVEVEDEGLLDPIGLLVVLQVAELGGFLDGLGGALHQALDLVDPDLVAGLVPAIPGVLPGLLEVGQAVPVGQEGEVLLVGMLALPVPGMFGQEYLRVDAPCSLGDWVSGRRFRPVVGDPLQVLEPGRRLFQGLTDDGLLGLLPLIDASARQQQVTLPADAEDPLTVVDQDLGPPPVRLVPVLGELRLRGGDDPAAPVALQHGVDQLAVPGLPDRVPTVVVPGRGSVTAGVVTGFRHGGLD